MRVNLGDISEVEMVEYDVDALKDNGISQIFLCSIISFLVHFL